MKYFVEDPLIFKDCYVIIIGTDKLVDFILHLVDFTLLTLPGASIVIVLNY